MPMISEVQQALARCLDAEPPKGTHLALSPDSNQLANVFAEMIFFKEIERPRDRLTSRQLEAFTRWLA
jgi:ATP-dependent exoDNAse (exonuclease V) alpha subunit